MKFVDEATITVQSGHGGSGCVSFRREKFIPNGGPNGGDGGKGGDVVIEATHRRRTLYQFRYNRQFKAKNGSPGQGNQRSGKNGQRLIIEIPPGTVVTNPDTGDVLYDFINAGDSYVVAKGGIGGRGNARAGSLIEGLS